MEEFKRVVVRKDLEYGDVIPVAIFDNPLDVVKYIQKKEKIANGKYKYIEYTPLYNPKVEDII